jgi:hypothetical protein
MPGRGTIDAVVCLAEVAALTISGVIHAGPAMAADTAQPPTAEPRWPAYKFAWNEPKTLDRSLLYSMVIEGCGETVMANAYRDALKERVRACRLPAEMASRLLGRIDEAGSASARVIAQFRREHAGGWPHCPMDASARKSLDNLKAVLNRSARTRESLDEIVSGPCEGENSFHLPWLEPR